MRILTDVLAELFGMFVADARLTFAILVLVGASAALIDLTDIGPLFGGGLLLVGCQVVVVGSVHGAARQRKRAEAIEVRQGPAAD
jgi:hypothetical protein